LPPVNRLYTELRGRGLEVRLISFREDPELVVRTARERGYTAPVLIDRSGEVTGKLYGVFGPPTAYLIDRRGRLVGHIIGARDWSTPLARKLLIDLLEQPARP
jgi:AhpC/TSA family protein